MWLKFANLLLNFRIWSQKSNKLDFFYYEPWTCILWINTRADSIFSHTLHSCPQRFDRMLKLSVCLDWIHVFPVVFQSWTVKIYLWVFECSNTWIIKQYCICLNTKLYFDNCLKLGAEVGARAISHLEEVSDKGIQAMAAASVVAVLLPTTAYILRLKCPPARKMINAGKLLRNKY